MIVNYDDINMSDGPATSDVEVSLVLNTADAWNPVSAWTDEKWHVPTNWHIRLGAWESEPPAESEYDTDDMLVRYFWDYASGPTARSGFTNLTSASVPVMRVHQYGTPGDEFMVLSQIVMPYEYPSDRTDMADVAYGALDTLDFYIDSAFTAAINHPDTIWVYEDSVTTFADTGSHSSGNASWEWDFDGDGEPDTTGISVDTLFSSTGVYPVVLIKTYEYHDLEARDTVIVVVGTSVNAGVIDGYYEGWPSDNEIEKGGECMWGTGATGGFPGSSYQYQWQRWITSWEVLVGETESELYLENVGNQDFDLRVIISSAISTDTTDVLSMTVSRRGQECNIWK